MTPGPEPTGPERGQAVEHVAADRQRRAADHEVDHDHEEGRRHADTERGTTQPADVGEVMIERRLEHPDEESGRQGDRERRETPDQRRRERGQDQAGELVDVQPAEERDDQDAGQSREPRTDRPVGAGDQVGGPPDRRRRPLVLRHRGGGKPEAGESVDQPEHRGEPDRDREHDRGAARQRHVAPEIDDVTRIERGQQDRRGSPLEQVTDLGAGRGERGQDREYAQGGHQSRQRRRLAERPHDQHVGEEPEERGGEYASRQRGPETPPLFGKDPARLHRVVVEGVVDEGAHHPHRPLGEVDDAGSPIDEDDALRRQRVQRAEAETQERELQELVHPIDSPRRRVGAFRWMITLQGPLERVTGGTTRCPSSDPSNRDSR